LTPENAIPHLYHFCAVLPADPYVDTRPEFIISDGQALLEATVILPVSVPPELRRASSRRRWRTERTVKRDAAFEAVKQLHDAGLINDHLLPLIRHDADEEAVAAIEKKPKAEDVAELFDPWVELAKAHAESGHSSATCLTIKADEMSLLSVKMLLPAQPPLPPPFDVHLDQSTRWTVSSARAHDVMSQDHASQVYEATHMLLQSVFQHRMLVGQKDFVPCFVPDMTSQELRAWAQSSVGCRPALEVHAKEPEAAFDKGIVRHVAQNRQTYLFTGWNKRRVELLDAVQDRSNEWQLHIEARRLPKPANLLHALPKLKPAHSDRAGRGGTKQLPAAECEIDNMPARYSQFALCVPSILRQYTIHMIADRLNRTILAPAALANLEGIAEAICASSAHETRNYQRLEFLGDSVLKMCTALQLMGAHTQWHEGYLSAHKDRIVANWTLARAALDAGLDAFIVTKPFVLRRWRPFYQSTLLPLEATTAPSPRRQVSSKVLADVVESLIGAAFLEGCGGHAKALESGYVKALECIRIFLPKQQQQQQVWSPRAELLCRLHDAVPSNAMAGLWPAHFDELEELIGYKFTKKLLLVEAMTHSSYAAADTPTVSYQRLEFLGDAVLDQLVTTALYDIGAPRLAHFDMHLMRTALVNADFLAFLCMELATTQERIDIVSVVGNPVGYGSSGISGSGIGKGSTAASYYQFRQRPTHARHALWQFMRHSSADIAHAQAACARRYGAQRARIRHALETRGAAYPWLALCRMRADKFFSDVVESVLGAVFVDAQGALAPCAAFAERVGVLPYLRRVVAQHMRLLHPKEELGRAADRHAVHYFVTLDDDDDNNDDGGDDDDDYSGDGAATDEDEKKEDEEGERSEEWEEGNTKKCEEEEEEEAKQGEDENERGTKRAQGNDAERSGKGAEGRRRKRRIGREEEGKAGAEEEEEGGGGGGGSMKSAAVARHDPANSSNSRRKRRFRCRVQVGDANNDDNGDGSSGGGGVVAMAVSRGESKMEAMTCAAQKALRILAASSSTSFSITSRKKRGNTSSQKAKEDDKKEEEEKAKGSAS
jgi:dsRNA-specific ribonuclease